MYKSKDGKVMASLTEVKNKTGDIFTLVDEFGEVILTSYNKPRYRIIKIGIADILETKQTKEEAPAEAKSVIAKVKEKVIKKPEEPKATTVEDEAQSENEGMLNKDILAKLSKLKEWDRSNKNERNFVSKAIMPLQ